MAQIAGQNREIKEYQSGTGAIKVYNRHKE